MIHNQHAGVDSEMGRTASADDRSKEMRTNPTPNSPKPASYAEVSQDQPGNGTKGNKLPDWITNNLRDSRSLKDLARCWLVSWVAIILLLPNKSLETLGQAAFFVCMITIFLPSNMPLFLWLLANASLLFGACVGWAWGCAAMASALLARDTTLLQRQQQTVSASVAGATNPESAFAAAIFQANFLDGRSSAVYGVFLATGSYAAAVIFTQSPKLRFTAIFMTIVLDVLCTYGPLFPVKQYTLGSIFLLPIGVSLGISFCCMMLVFPETLSHSWQRNLTKLISANKAYLKTQSDLLLALSRSSDMSTVMKQFEEPMKAKTNNLIALLEALDLPKVFLPMEITYAPLSGQDLSMLLLPTRTLVLRLLGLASFRVALQTTSKEDEQAAAGDQSADELEDLNRPIHVHDTHTMLDIHEKVKDAEKSNHVAFKEDLLPVLVEGSEVLMSKSFAALDAIIAWLEYTNLNRWRGQSQELYTEHINKLQKVKDDLDEALRLFDSEERRKLMLPYEHHFTSSDGTDEMILAEEEGKSFRLGARGLFLSMMWCSNAINSARQIVVLTVACHTLALKRPKSRVWMPRAVSKLGHAIMSKKEGTDAHHWPTDSTNLRSLDAPHEEEDAEEEDFLHEDSGITTRVGSVDIERDTNARSAQRKLKAEAEASLLAAKKEKQRLRRLAQRDADSLPPTKWYHHVGRFLAACHTFCWSPRGVFALRYTIAGIAVWIPSVATQQSAAFSYQQRGLWAIIMAQLTVSLTHGELVFSVLTRGLGTVVGALLGAVLWYISCGEARQGNVYGFAAVTAVVLLPGVFFRLFAPLQHLFLTLMTTVTIILTLGYSWIDGHLVVTVNSGVGIGVAWRRMLLVLVGMAAGIIVMIIPRPASTRVAVRQSLAQLSQRNLALYSNLVEIWAVQSASFEGDSAGEGKELSTHGKKQKERLNRYRYQLLAAYEAHKEIGTQIQLARLDLQLRGRWPGSRYEQLLKAQGNMLAALSQLYAVASDEEYTAVWQRRFAHSTALLDPSTISDVSLLLSLLAQALQTGSRLPHATFLVRERALRHQGEAIRMEEQLRRMGSEHATPPLSLDILQAPPFMKHVQGAVALQIFLANLDEAAAIVRALVGEVPLNGYDALKDRWDDRALLLSS